MYKVISVGAVGLATSEEEIKANLQASLNKTRHSGFRVVAATSGMVIMYKEGAREKAEKKREDQKADVDTNEPKSEVNDGDS